MQEAQQGVEHRVTEREWAGEGKMRLPRRADKGAITRIQQEADSERPALKTSVAAEAAGERGVLLSVL